MKATADAMPAAPAVGALPADVGKHAAASAKWEVETAIQGKALSVARSTAVAALQNAGIRWPGDFPNIDLTPAP